MGSAQNGKHETYGRSCSEAADRRGHQGHHCCCLMGWANNRTFALANRSVAGSEGDPNRGSFQPAFADESIDRMCNRSSDRGREGKPSCALREQARSHNDFDPLWERACSRRRQ
ncbi:hypothetical protein PG5_31610 [Pseudomonas sp. G5(2012)]|nr:hypothetical protein PG5_31610 [Pseudomonas sp. G5(2012)]